MNRPIALWAGSLLAFLLPLATAFAQDSAVMQMPYFVGCTAFADGSVEKRQCSQRNLTQYIAEKITEAQRQDSTQLHSDGAVFVAFEVNADGMVERPEILRGGNDSERKTLMSLLRDMPTWEAARNAAHQAITTRLTLPIRFKTVDAADANGFRLSWGLLRGQNVSKADLKKHLEEPILVRDDAGNLLEISELLIERARKGKFAEVQSNGKLNDEQSSFIKKLRTGDQLLLTATVQKAGQFHYVQRTFSVE
jgi:hypothetical protein